MDATPQIDRDYLCEISGGDGEFERELIQTFLESAPALVQTYSSAATEGDIAMARNAAHTLKGSSRSIGATQFALVCEAAERAARAEDLAGCKNLVPNIATAYQALKFDGEIFIAEAA